MYEQENNENANLSVINIGKWEDKLRMFYGTSKNEQLLIFKIDAYKEGYYMPKVEYEIYRVNTGEKLELNICNEMTVDLSVSVTIEENNIFLYGPNSDFYNDVCYVYTSKSGTDISLEDRKKEYKENIMTLCEENCEFKDYDYKNKKALCECKIKINFFSISEITIDKAKLYNSFTDLSTVANLDIMKCYHILFSKQGTSNNIGVYIFIPIIIFQVIFIFIFFWKIFANKINKSEKNLLNKLKLDEDIKYNEKEEKIENIKENIGIKGDKIEKKKANTKEGKNENKKQETKLEINFNIKLDNDLLSRMKNNIKKIENKKIRKLENNKQSKRN